MLPPLGNANFYRVISDAIADFTAHGFDSQERLDRWLTAIEAAGRRLLLPTAVLRQKLEDELKRVFARTVGNPANIQRLLRQHPGVSAFTVQNLKPRLVLELNRRILASSRLIELNRHASMARTRQRFAGWATSIPAGGSRAVDKKEEAETVRRGIAALPYEDRRCIIDQGFKLVSAIHDVIAKDGGALGGYWKHVKEGPPAYDSRPQHVAWDKAHKFFVIRDNWALKAGLMKLNGHQYTDEVEQPGELVYCSCHYQYAYSLRELPDGMLTTSGKAELQRVRAILQRA